ncbi:response regulator [Streptomyces turgidiscabies]|uniref:Prevent-host-death family protein n=1 Tax=Streptomyces turgidiscabies (strain Car8) TaxID=698760 RepID=L7FEJ8_STRT8|nr:MULTISPECIES: response regulator [Streptomyces]ELP69823.1 prevent-host-death family protein [Streptomyces turgidiscabies Car8]MDX3496804.1 response regulator [Streptomyces turgidiscabies]GAQ74090.1 transcriptional regulatory protein LiaR [Streptomyces turgidiscabies]
MTTRVVVADDQVLVRTGFRMIIDARDDLEVVGEASDGQEAVRLTRELTPDVVLMDVRMPVLDGIEATRRIAESGSGARVLVLTTWDVDAHVVAALRAGASGFLLKDIRPTELVDAIRLTARGDALLARDVLACLRRVEVSRLLAAQDTDQQPAHTTLLLPGDPGEAIAAGRFHHVPVLIGNNHDEGNGWAAGIIQAGYPVTPDTWPDVAATFFPSPGQAQAIVREYPVHRTDGGPVFGAVIGDADFACPTARTDSLLSAQVPVWRYEFADKHAPPLTPGKPPFPLGAPHASELPYLFDLGGRPRDLTTAQHRLADTMIDYWTHFAHTADPNGPSSPHWPQGTVLTLAPDHVVPTPTTGQLRHHCAFWDTR